MPGGQPLVSDVPPPRPSSFDGVLGRQIIALHVWAVGQGLRGVTADLVMDGLCRRLVEAGVPLWRAFAGMRTLHPQWGGYGYTWRRDLNAIQPEQYERGSEYEQNWLESPFAWLVSQEAARADGTPPWPSLRRRLAGPEAQLDFPVLRGVSAAGGTDYFAHLVMFGAQGDASRGSGVGISFTTDRPEGFDDDHIVLLRAVLPAASLALMADAGHTIASGLLAAYLGADAGKRVHQGAVARGSVEAIRAVLWYADIRGFTAIADGTPGLAVIEMLDEAFETLTASLRARGGQVLKFIGDGMLAIFPFVEGTREETCGHALDAAAEAMRAVDRLNAGSRRRRQAGRRGRSGAPSGRGALRQCRRRRPPRLYRDRPGGQRGRPHRDPMRTFGLPCSGVGRARGGDGEQRPPQAARAASAARRSRGAGNLCARSRRLATGPGGGDDAPGQCA